MQPLFHPSFGKISYLVQSDAALMSFSLKNPNDYGSATNWSFNQWRISTISSFIRYFSFLNANETVFISL